MSGDRDREAPALDTDVRALLARRAERIRAPEAAPDADDDAMWVASFVLGERQYAIALSALRAAIPLRMVTPVPHASSAVIGGLPAPSLEDVALDGTPGSRLPHAWLDRDGARLSTLDLTGTGFGLLAGPDGGAWREAAAGLGEDVVAGRVDGDWPDAAGVGPAGALLVRPDRIVAWRATTPAPADAAERLRAVLDEVLSRGGRRRPASARTEDSAAPA